METVTFGRYPQNSDRPEPLEWIVLDEKDGNKLLLTKYIIEAMPFHEKYEEVTWADSSLRRWLNQAFYDEAFSSQEQEHIQKVHLKNEDPGEILTRETILDPDYPTIKHNIDVSGKLTSEDTEDQIFLLSVDEAKQYGDHCLGWIRATEHAMKKNLSMFPIRHIDKQGRFGEVMYYAADLWWLRIRGEYGDHAACVSKSIVNEAGFPVFFHETVMQGVRPAMWVTGI